MAIELKHGCERWDVKCSQCRVCDPLRQTHQVPTSAGVAAVTRCSHCDGHDAHTSVRPHTAHAPDRGGS